MVKKCGKSLQLKCHPNFLLVCDLHVSHTGRHSQQRDGITWTWENDADGSKFGLDLGQIDEFEFAGPNHQQESV